MQTAEHRRTLPSLIGFAFLVAAISYFSSLITIPNVESWYQTINKPEWNPPDWVFGPVWTVLYIMIALSGWRIWNKIPSDDVTHKILTPAMRPYWWQLALNFAWTPAFFGFHSPVAGAIVITFLLAAILWNIFIFNLLDKVAAYLLVPYAIWVSYALSLNHSIVQLN